MVIRDVAESDDDGYVLGLREDASERSSGILFFASLEGAEEDDEIGMDTYCIVVEPGQATYYGGVIRCEVQDATEPAGRCNLLLHLEGEAAETLGMARVTTFELLIDASRMRVLRNGLRRALTSGRSNAVPALINV